MLNDFRDTILGNTAKNIYRIFDFVKNNPAFYFLMNLMLLQRQGMMLMNQVN